jgi:20S proteasome alpha/beta subunit
MHGTLILYIATNDGLVVAADSRASVDSTLHCDDAVKIVPRRRYSRTVLTVGGNDMIVIGHGNPATDPCEYDV